MGKGEKWERDTCHSLSQWWSKKGDDDLFWRTHGSGARATSRSKKNKKTRGQYGDICAVDSRGRTFTKVFTVSLKRGYSHKTLQDLIDALENPNRDGAIPEQEYAGWIREAIFCDRLAGSLFWMIIVRRDKRKGTIIVPGYFLLSLDWVTRKKIKKIIPQAQMVVKVCRNPPLTQKDKEGIKKKLGKKKAKKFIRKYIKKNNKRSLLSIHAYPMQDFLDIVDRSIICRIHKDNKNVKSRMRRG